MHHQFNDTYVLLEFYGRRFTGSTHRHNTVHAAFHLQLHELLEGGFVQLAFEKGVTSAV